MSRNLEQEMDDLREQVSEIKNMVMEFTKPPQKKDGINSLKNIHPMKNMHPDKRLSEVMDELCEKVDNDGNTGSIIYMGVFSSGNRQSNWIRNQVDTDGLFNLIESNTAVKVLACIGNSDRLNILLALLREPMTVATLVEKHGYKSTGQVYHHLKPLLTADIITEDKNAAKGTYFVQPHRVQGIIMLLAGIHDMIDNQFTKGEWGSEIHAGATMVDERYMTTAEEKQKIIETYFISLAPLVLKEFPPKEKKKLVILRVISEQFEAGKRYSEKEVNQVLKPIYDDHATIRRYLIEYGFMERTQNCEEYWLME